MKGQFLRHDHLNVVKEAEAVTGTEDSAQCTCGPSAREAKVRSEDHTDCDANLCATASDRVAQRCEVKIPPPTQPSGLTTTRRNSAI